MKAPINNFVRIQLTVAYLTATVSANAAFQNLDFETPLLPLVPEASDPFGRVPIANALPTWTAYVGTDVEPLASYNSAFLNSPGVSLLGPGRPWPSGLSPTIVPNVIAGSYSALIQCGVPLFHPGQPIPSSGSLAQIGLVPDGSHSLLLSIDAHVPFTVSLGGQPLTLVPTQVNPTYTVFGADVSGFSGQDAELRITTAALGFGYLWVDSIHFSPMPVPEPSPLTLGLVGLAMLGIIRGLRRWQT